MGLAMIGLSSTERSVITRSYAQIYLRKGTNFVLKAIPRQLSTLTKSTVWTVSLVCMVCLAWPSGIAAKNVCYWHATASAKSLSTTHESEAISYLHLRSSRSYSTQESSDRLMCKQWRII